MQINKWKYYNHAAIPTVAPHEPPNMLPIKDNSIWKIGEKAPLLARWTTDFDCSNETNWWYVIKDTPFDIDALKAKRRYEINKGIRNFDVVPINPADYSDELYSVQVAAFSAYPEKYRPKVNKENFCHATKSWGDNYTVFGAFSRVSNELCGYAMLSKEKANYIDFCVQKTNPKHEKLAVNAALVNGVLEYFREFLEIGGYICDGTRSINHKTEFQNYLEKYFGFRKAYCKLNIAYNPKFKWIIKCAFTFRKLLFKLDRIGAVHNLNSILKMEEIVRKNNE